MTDTLNANIVYLQFIKVSDNLHSEVDRPPHVQRRLRT